jgi:hypothetical protein
MKRLLASLSILLAACSHQPPPAAPEIYPCYKAKTYREYKGLVKKRALKPNTPLTVAGKKFACVESALEAQINCYVANTQKEYDKLSRQQERQPDWPVKAGDKYYRCIQMVQ